MSGNPLSNPNWAPDLANTVERYVGVVRDKATLKAVVVVRGLVFGIIIGVGALVASVLGVILGIKLVQRVVNLFGWIDTDSSVWVSYVAMGVLLCLAGAVCMSKRATKEAA